jgi:hypothetical protein
MRVWFGNVCSCVGRVHSCSAKIHFCVEARTTKLFLQQLQKLQKLKNVLVLKTFSVACRKKKGLFLALIFG